MKITLLTAFLFVSISSTAFPMGADHGPVGQTSLRADMSPKLQQLINRDDRVHGYFVNSEDVFFYAGNTKALNEFMSLFAELEHTNLEISINQSLTHASSPWDKAERETVANWQLYSAPYDEHAWHTAMTKIREAQGDDIEALRAKTKEFSDGPEVARLQFRVGGEIELEKLDIPQHIKLTIINEDEATPKAIKEFVARHERLRTKTSNQ
jgi:hypothetical protein